MVPIGTHAKKFQLYFLTFSMVAKPVHKMKASFKSVFKSEIQFVTSFEILNPFLNPL
jgi:hypothetical protein